MMHGLLKKFKSIFSDIDTAGHMAWFGVAIIATIALSLLGFDAWWLAHVQGTEFAMVFSLAGVVGFVMPGVIWSGLLMLGYIHHDRRMRTAAWMAMIAGTLGWVMSVILKAFTGRVGPPFEIMPNLLDLSQTFQLGFMRGGIFWGWPSSHTTVAFAMSVALAVFYREKRWVKYVAIGYATYIAMGASMSFHWLGDVVAGVILGVIVGVAVGRVFRGSKDTKKKAK